MRLHVWTDLAPSRQAQAILTATMHDVGIRCVDMTLGLLRFQLHFTCSATFFSFEVRACCDRLCCRFHRQEVVSVVVILKSKLPVISTSLSKESALSVGGCNCRLLGCSRRALSAVLVLRLLTVRLRMNCIASRNHTSASYLNLSLQLSVLPLRADLPWKVLVVSNHALLKNFFNVRNRAFRGLEW